MTKPYGYVYLVTDLVTNMLYIGKHKSPKVFDSTYNPSGKLIKRYMKKYGKERFKIQPIDYAHSLGELNELEEMWIEKMDCIWPKGYNLVKYASGGPIRQGMKNSKESKEKCSKMLIGHIVTEETRQKIGAHLVSKETREKQKESALNRKHPEDCTCGLCIWRNGTYNRKGQNNAFYGHTHTEEAIQKNREKHLGKRWLYSSELNKAILVRPELVPEYQSNGWVEGRIGRG